MDIISFIQIAQYNLPLYLGAFLVYISIIWLAVVLWVWSDIKSRTYSVVARLAAVLLTLGANIPGLVIYLLLRPYHTLEERESNSLFHASILDKTINACPNCSHLVREEFKHCPNCQHTLMVICERCDARVNPTWNYCVSCGKRKYPETDQEKLGRRIRKLSVWVFAIPERTLALVRKGWDAYIRVINTQVISRWQRYAAGIKAKREEMKAKRAEEKAKQEEDKVKAKSKKQKKKDKKKHKKSKSEEDSTDDSSSDDNKEQ